MKSKNENSPLTQMLVNFTLGKMNMSLFYCWSFQNSQTLTYNDWGVATGTCWHGHSKEITQLNKKNIYISSHIYFSCPSHLSAHWCLAMSFNVCEKNNKERARQYEQERILNLLNESHSSALQFWFMMYHLSS